MSRIQRIQEVRITLEHGKIKIECDGFQGKECDSISEIENSLGNIVNREATSEAFVEVQELPEFVKQGI